MDKKDMKFSIIIPVYNAAPYIEKCIDSVLSQTYGNFEIILVNDGSVDSSESIMEKYVNMDSRVTVLKQKNLGVSAARNHGIQKSEGDWILFVDADDLLTDRALERVGNVISSEPDLELICFSYIEKKGGNIIQREFADNILMQTSRELLYRMFDDVKVQGYVWNKVFNRKILDDYKIRFDLKMSVNEDLLFCYEYTTKIEKGAYIDQGLYVYVKHISSVMSGIVQEKSLTAFNAFDKILDNCSDLECKQWVRAAYIKMILYLSKKGLQCGCQSGEVRKQLKVKLQQQLRMEYAPLRKSPRRWIWVLTKIPIVYLFMRVRE